MPVKILNRIAVKNSENYNDNSNDNYSDNNNECLIKLIMAHTKAAVITSKNEPIPFGLLNEKYL
jgi:rRNA-processing protein FCF1